MYCKNCAKYEERYIVDEEEEDYYFNLKRSGIKTNFTNRDFDNSRYVELRSIGTIIRNMENLEEKELQGIKLNDFVLYPISEISKVYIMFKIYERCF